MQNVAGRLVLIGMQEVISTEENLKFNCAESELILPALNLSLLLSSPFDGPQAHFRKVKLACFLKESGPRYQIFKEKMGKFKTLDGST
ncbi:hypothetical protein CDAR_181181 [Caerostris darwini]|uniref:Uncharacterized protein n=1 Tax=Caerostris darwini TaxID=1538125 RepID=A0AAV4U3R6_9ARAC|nr:hypothetical protein CDAR_181181 [Caerostris darwini]